MYISCITVNFMQLDLLFTFKKKLITFHFTMKINQVILINLTQIFHLDPLTSLTILFQLTFLFSKPFLISFTSPPLTLQSIDYNDLI